MNALSHAAASIDAVTRCCPERDADDYLVVEDCICVTGVKDQETRLYYNVERDERGRWWADFQYAVLIVGGQRIRIYQSELTDSEYGVVSDLLFDHMRECEA